MPLEQLERDLRAAAARCLSGDAAAEKDVERLSRRSTRTPRGAKEGRRTEGGLGARRAAALFVGAAAHAARAAAVARGARRERRHVGTGGPAAGRGAPRVSRARALADADARQSRPEDGASADLRRLDLGRLDAVELRAVYAALPPEFDADGDGAKAMWREDARRRLSALRAPRGGRQALLRREVRHPVYDALDAVGGPFDPDSEAAAATPTTTTTSLESELAAVRARGDGATP